MLLVLRSNNYYMYVLWLLSVSVIHTFRLYVYRYYKFTIVVYLILLWPVPGVDSGFGVVWRGCIGLREGWGILFCLCQIVVK